MKERTEEPFSESDQLLVVEALYRLREVKQEALKAIRGVGHLVVGGQEFEERDFGIPQIDRLIARLDC